jgi:hypothetical protein
MPLPDDIRALADRSLDRLDESRDYYLHTQQAWRVVQQIAHEGRAVGIVDAASGGEVPAQDLEPLAQRYVTVHLAESVFRSLSGLRAERRVAKGEERVVREPLDGRLLHGPAEPVHDGVLEPAVGRGGQGAGAPGQLVGDLQCNGLAHGRRSILQTLHAKE